jgi:putative ABC transport system substrate-binding protein
MNRRAFIAALGGAAAWPIVAGAQPDRVWRIGVLIGVAESDPETKTWVATFRKRLDELGWKVGGNVQIDERWTAGDPDRNRQFASELVAKKPDVIFAFSSVVVAALQRESRSVPIVFTAISDPVGSGFVESLARPGGNATGFTNYVPTKRRSGWRSSKRPHRRSDGHFCSSIRRPPPMWRNITSVHSKPRHPLSA